MKANKEWTKAGTWPKACAAAGTYLLVVAATEISAHWLLSFAGAEHIEWILFLITAVLIGSLVQYHLVIIWRRNLRQREITHWLSALGGDDFFPLLAQNLARSLGADCALICTLTDDGMGNLRSLAAFCHGRHLEPFECSFAGTPAETVLQERRLVCLSDGVRERLTAHHLPQGLAADSFLGVPMIGTGGRAFGLLALLDNRSLCNREGAEETVQLAAVRAVSELERQHFEEALQQKRDRLQAIITTALDAIVEIDDEGTITAWNPRAERIFGWAADEAVDRPLVKLIIPPQHREAHTKGLKHFLATGEGPILNRHIEITALRRSGEEFPVELTVTPIRHKDRYTFTAFLRDITDRREKEEEISSLNAHLRERAHELEAVNEKLSAHQIELETHNEELRQAHQETEEQRRRYQDLYDFAPVGYFTLDPQGVILEINLAGVKLLGKSRSFLTGQPLVSFLTPDSMRKFGEFCRDIFSGEGREQCELQLSAKAFGGRWYLVEGMTVPKGDGDQPACRIAFVDVTELHQAREALLESEERFRATFNQAAVGIAHVDLDGHWLRINQRYCDILGYSVEELTTLTITDITHPDDRQVTLKHLELLLAGTISNYTLEKRYVRKDGSTIWVNLTVSTIADADGRPRFIVGIVEDITSRKEAEEALRLSETRYRALYRDNPVMIATVDTDWTMLSVNPSCANQLGYSIEELEGQSVLMLFHEDDRLAVTKQLWNCLQNPDQIYSWQFRKVRKDGEILWVEEVAQTLYDPGGAFNILVVCQDITERKRAQEEIERLNSDLATRAAELEDANRELETFNYAVAHDLRKPLTIINGYCQVLKDFLWRSARREVHELSS